MTENDSSHLPTFSFLGRKLSCRKKLKNLLCREGMVMIHFTERKHLIQWLMENCTRKVVVRAMDEGSVENLGRFRDVGPTPVQSGWIIKVTSDRGKVWALEIVPRPASKRWHGYSIYITDFRVCDNTPISWKNWVGDAYTDPLYCGDNPQEYARLKQEALDE